jgi:hypothetical protein
MEPDVITVSVRLRRVTKEDCQAAIDAMESIFDEYELADDARMALWEHYQTFASDVLIRFGEFNPDVDLSGQNGHA